MIALYTRAVVKAMGSRNRSCPHVLDPYESNGFRRAPVEDLV